MYKNNIKPRILVIGATHGHEYLGVLVLKELKKLQISEEILQFEIGNLQAYRKGVTFIDSDLNRVFPGDKKGDYEQRRAYELSQKIRQVDIVIDIHATNTISMIADAMLIVTKLNPQTEELIQIINPPRLLLMRYGSDRAVISNAKIGIAFEYGDNDNKKAFESILFSIGEILCTYKIIKKNPYSSSLTKAKTKSYEVYDTYKKPCRKKCVLVKKVKNYKMINKGDCIARCGNETICADETFIPILFGENRYKEILGFRSRRI